MTRQLSTSRRDIQNLRSMLWNDGIFEAKSRLKARTMPLKSRQQYSVTS